MTHCSDDDLVLHYYEEDDGPAEHLTRCVECTDRYRALAALLEPVAALEVPDRGEVYGRELWLRIHDQLEPRPWWMRTWHALISPAGTGWRWAVPAAAAVVLVAGGFIAGREWPAAPPDDVAVVPVEPADDGARQRRDLLLTVADHLEQSERVLTDLVNAPGGIDISTEQEWATELVAASRLYRQEAINTNEVSVVAVLDELERALLDVVHRPSKATDEDLEEIRRRVESASLLFKVRVMSSELRGLTEYDLDASVPSTGSIG